MRARCDTGGEARKRGACEPSCDVTKSDRDRTKILGLALALAGSRLRSHTRLMAERLGTRAMNPTEPPVTVALVREAKAQATIVGSLVGVMWVEELLDTILLHGSLDRFGIRPRSLDGLLGIFLAPFLHGGFGHLIANTVPFMVLAFLIMLRRKRDLLVVSAITTVVGGLGVWLIGSGNSVHIGASILVFGFLGYMLSRSVFERSFWAIVGSVVVFFLYGGALFGVLPGQAGISWEGHLFGFIGGVLSARALSTPRIDARVVTPPPRLQR